MNPPDEASAAWAALAAHRDNLAGTHLRELVGDADRIDLLTVEVADLRLDLSRQPLTATTVDLLVDLPPNGRWTGLCNACSPVSR